MGRRKTYEKLSLGIEEGLRHGKVNGQSFQPLIDHGHTLETVLQEYVVCGGSKGNMLNMLDENFDTEDFFGERFGNPYRRCLCGKRDLAENVYITRFDPSTSTGVNETNPILAIGTHCQTYFPTLEEKHTDYINQENKRANESDATDPTLLRNSPNDDADDAEEDDEEEEEEEVESEYLPTDEDYEDEDYENEYYDDEEQELESEEYQPSSPTGVTEPRKSPPPPIFCLDEEEEEEEEEDHELEEPNHVPPCPLVPNVSFTLHPFGTNDRVVLQQEPYALEEIAPLLSCSKIQDSTLREKKRHLYQKLQKYHRKIAKVYSQLQRLDEIL
jgi:hypothetical protein